MKWRKLRYLPGFRRLGKGLCVAEWLQSGPILGDRASEAPVYSCAAGEEREYEMILFETDGKAPGEIRLTAEPDIG